MWSARSVWATSRAAGGGQRSRGGRRSRDPQQPTGHPPVNGFHPSLTALCPHVVKNSSQLRHPLQLALSHAFSLSQSQRIRDDMAGRKGPAHRALLALLEEV